MVTGKLSYVFLEFSNPQMWLCELFRVGIVSSFTEKCDADEIFIDPCQELQEASAADSIYDQ